MPHIIPYSAEDRAAVLRELGISPMRELVLTSKGEEFLSKLDGPAWREWVKTQSDGQHRASGDRLLKIMRGKGYLEVKDDLLAGEDVARIYTWRRKLEYPDGPPYTYKADAPRAHAWKGFITTFHTVNLALGKPHRQHYYSIQSAFDQSIDHMRASMRHEFYVRTKGNSAVA